MIMKSNSAYMPHVKTEVKVFLTTELTLINTVLMTHVKIA